MYLRIILTFNAFNTFKVGRDTDGDALGVGIVAGKSSSIGKFQYKCDGGSEWEDVELTTNTLPVSGSTQVIYLRPADSIKFSMAGDSFWTTPQAISSASVHMMVWDGSDGGGCGARTADFNGDVTHLSATTTMMMQLR